MRRSEVEKYLEKSSAPLELLEELVESGKVVKPVYRGEEFYMRKLPGRRPSR